MSTSTAVAIVLSALSTTLTNVAYLREHDAAAALPVLSMRRPLHSADLRRIRSYPDGYQVDALGTFPRGCPVPHETDAPVQESA